MDAKRDESTVDAVVKAALNFGLTRHSITIAYTLHAVVD
jgi:hypothetical protein